MMRARPIISTRTRIDACLLPCLPALAAPSACLLQRRQPMLLLFSHQKSLRCACCRDVFLQSAQFLVAARGIQELIREFHPTRVAPGKNKLRTYCNEIGVLAPDPPPGILPFGKDRWWWNLEAAQFGYVYASLAAIGVDAMAASQLTGYPGNAASISMLDWTTGQGNAWFWVLKMFTDTLGSGPKAVHRTLVNGASSSLRAPHI